ncbi:MAG: component of SCAR regulatory complex, partial [Trebouxia sp. A1-2]
MTLLLTAYDLQEFIRKGKTVLAAVYTFRSMAKASLKDVTPAGGLSASLQQQTIYQPALRVVAAAQQFCTEVGEALIMIFVGMIAPDGIGVNSSQALLRHITMLFDQIHVLDALKTAKVSLADSVAMAKHAQQQHNSSIGQQHQDQEEEADFDGLLEFLEDPWWCVKMLHSSTKQVNYQHRVVGRIVQYICESLTDKENSAPQVVGLESHVYLRALPVALYLLFPYDDGKVGLEAIGSRQMQRGLKLLKQKPIVPAIGDMPLSLMHILHQLSPFLVAHAQENKESGILPAEQLSSKQHVAVGQQYDLQRKTAAVAATHDAFTEAFAGYAVQMDDYRMTGQAVAPQLLQQGLALATEGLKHVSTWSAHIQELHSWKLSNHQPQPLRRVNVKQVIESPRDHSLRQQYSPQSSPARAPAQEDELNATPQRQQQTLLAQPSSKSPTNVALDLVLEQQGADTHLASQTQLDQNAGSPSRSVADQQAATYSAEQITTHLQQLSPSQRLAQSSALKAALAAAAASSPVPASHTLTISGADPALRDDSHVATADLFASPAAQAARAYASPEPSPTYASQLNVVESASSPAATLTVEAAASPVSPQSVKHTQTVGAQPVFALPAARAAPIVPAQIQQSPPVPIVSRDVGIVSVSQGIVGPTLVPAPANIMLQQTAVQPPPTVEAVNVDRSLKPPLGTQPVPAAPVPRPAGAFSYTAPLVVPSTAPASADRYIPAVGYSPSRARVARDPPADAAMGHVRKQSFAANALDRWPAVPAVPALQRQEVSGEITAASNGAVYGPGVTSRPLTGPASAAPDQIVATASPQPAAAPQAVQFQAPADIPSSAVEQAIIVEPVGVPAAPPMTSPPKSNSNKLRNATGVCDIVPAISVAVAQVPGPGGSTPERAELELGTDGTVLKDGAFANGAPTMTPVGPQSTKRSRFGKLLSRAKGPGAASASEQPQQPLVAESAAHSIAPADAEMTSSATAAAPAHRSMRSRLFGRTKQQDPSAGLPVMQNDDLGTLQEESDEGFSNAAADFGEHAQNSIPMPDAVVHDSSLGIYDNASQDSVPAALALPSSALLSGALSATPTLGQAKPAEEAEVDPLSSLFEDRVWSPRLQPPSVMTPATAEADTASHPQQHLQPMTPMYGEFDPLTATIEDYHAYHSSQEQQAAPPLGFQDAEQPQRALVADAAAPPRKTRSMPRLFKLRKSAKPGGSPTAGVASDTELTEDTAIGEDAVQLTPEEPRPSTVDSNANQTAALSKPRSKKPFSLLRKHSKGNAHAAEMTQQQQQLAAETVGNPNAALPALAGGIDDPTGQQSTVETVSLTDRDPEQVHHANTQLGLSAGLPSTFGSFMAAAPRAPAEAVSDSPHKLTSPSPDLVEARSYQDNEVKKVAVGFSTSVWSSPEADTQRSMTAGNINASHHSSTSAVQATSYNSIPHSTQHEEVTPVASQEPDSEEDAAVIAAAADEEGVQSNDITLEVAEASATVPTTTSAPAEAFKSLWRMLSLNKSKPAGDANLPDEEAAKRQISAQLALAREVSEPAVIQAASDDQLQRPADLPQPTLASDADIDKSQAAALAKQPTAMAKRFSFLSTLRRGSTSADPVNASAVTVVTTEGLSKEAVRAIEAPAAPSDMGPVQYPAFAGTVPAPMDEYAPYPELSPVSEAPQVTERTELFLDYYSDVSRYDYQPGDLACMLEILACIKGVAALLQQADVWLSGYICQATFLQMQGFVQLAMTHLDPRNKGMQAVSVLHNSLGSPSAPQAAPAPTTKAKTFQKAKSLLSFRQQGSTAASSGSNRSSRLPAAYPALPPGQQQAVQQVAPTCVQMLALQYTAEQMIKEEAGKSNLLQRNPTRCRGKQWMKSVMDTESSLSKDAADMSALWLKEIHLENTLPSLSQPLAHSVPWQLAHHALVYPQERHIEVVLQSLEIYNDVQCSAVPALIAPHLAAEAHADAELCMRKLTTNLATEYKTAAANGLTDWAFVRAQYRDTVTPTAGVLRQFEELFRQHNVVVMGHSVDLGSAVAAHVQGLLYSNAHYLVALCEASNITCLVSIQGQVAVLEKAHAMLSAHLELDTWAQTWAEADGQQAFDAFSGRVAHCTTVQVLTDLLSNFGYCEPTQRFTRLAAQEARVPEPEADLPAFAYGPGGSVSGPAGLAMIVTAVMQHLGQLLQDPLPSALRPLLQNYPDELLRFAHSGGTPSNAAGLLAHVQHQVQQMLIFRGDWQAALPRLTELGNGLALISSLDAMLGAHGDAVSMQLAPMLGVSVSSAGHLQRM